MNQEKEDKLEVVNKKDEVIGLERRDIIHQKGLLHREVHVWFYNDRHEILFQHRAPNTETYPDLLDASVGGHVDLGETYETTAFKEITEETGLHANPDDLRFITFFRKKSFDEATGLLNNVLRKIFAYHFRADKNIIRIEKGMATGFEWWPIARLSNLSAEEQRRFIPTLIDQEYLSIYKKIDELIV